MNPIREINKSLRLAEIADLVNGQLQGDGDIRITGLSGIKEAREGDLTFLANPRYYIMAEETKASAILIPPGIKISGKASVLIPNPSLAFASVANKMYKEQSYPPQGIHPTAVIAPDVFLGKNVSIGPYTVIDHRAEIGDGTIIYSGCFVGDHTTMGKDCLIYPNVTIRERITLGHRVCIHSGTVIGSDGFGFVLVEGVHEKIPQIGTVVVGDDVEIGANVAIDRARFDKTVIGKGTKIDNLVQIAHNVIIGEDCIIVSQVGISGSTVVGKGVVLAGQVGVVGHITIGEGVVIASQSGVSKSIPPHTTVFGYPAKPMKEAKRINACVQRLPHYVKIIQDLQKKIIELEKEINKKKS